MTCKIFSRSSFCVYKFCYIKYHAENNTYVLYWDFFAKNTGARPIQTYRVWFFLDESHKKDGSVLVHSTFLKFSAKIWLFKLRVTTEPFFIFDFKPGIFDVFFLAKTDNFWQMSGINRKSKKPALQRNVKWKVILWSEISERSNVPIWLDLKFRFDLFQKNGPLGLFCE